MNKHTYTCTHTQMDAFVVTCAHSCIHKQTHVRASTTTHLHQNSYTQAPNIGVYNGGSGGRGVQADSDSSPEQSDQGAV